MSSRIAALEEELGVLLLDRRDKQFRLTVAGMRFFNHAQRLLALQRDIKSEMGAGAQRAEADVVDAAQRLVARWPAVREIVLECTNMPPYAKAVARATRRPVHHIISVLHERWNALDPAQ